MQTQESILAKMQETYTKLAGAAPEDASDIGIRLKILAEQIWQLNKRVDEAEKQAFPQTAEGEWLDLHAKQRAILRKEAVNASGTVTFSRSTPATTDLAIASEILLAAAGGESLRFVSTQPAVLLAGKTSVEVPVRCEVAGKIGNLAAGMLTVIVTPIQGIAQVNNLLPIRGGEERENDASLRQRLMDSYSALTNGTNSAFYYNFAMSYPGVSSVRIIPRMKGVGSVGIVLYGEGVNAALMEQIKADVGAVKELNVDVMTEKAVEKPLAIAAEIAVKNGYSYEDTASVCKERLTQLLARQKVGQALIHALLVKECLECEGVANCKFSAPANDLYPLEKEILTLSGITFTKMAVQA